MEQQIFTVTELNDRIKGLFELDPVLAGVCVRGELSNYKIYPSGHHYFTLKDANSSVRCVMFRGNASKLRFRPENGMGVLAYGRVDVYSRDGAYQLYCGNLTPEGMGDLYVAYEQLKAKLHAEGLFDKALKKSLPRYPDRIAVITSGAGAAVRDIIRVLGVRWPMSKVIILPVRVQGAEAPPEIVGALKYANKHKVADLIITGRGGGSIEDLWAFNDERVARAIAASQIPVISAVGHEPDVTISDYVADLRAATPSNAAELAVPDQSEMRENILAAEIRLNQAMRKKLMELKNHLEQIKNTRVMQTPTGYIDQKRMELDFIRNRLVSASERIVSGHRHEFVRLAASLDALSPLKVLSRGYSIATDEENNIIRDSAQVKVGGRLNLSLHKGRLKCLVEEKT
ncbi:MAG TPA: exodeoxyribonuclease VII large subunit [Clostridiales bacterium]|jgi:exodeoxyribonuclease VII large subunit|nr:exodeoxyribonuclease VII large subunit [Clostridiales bacterium]